VLRQDIANKREIDKEQTKQINQLDHMVSEIRKNIHVNKSVTTLEYQNKDGSEVTFHREQEILCSSKEYPIKETKETIELDPPGTVEFIEGTKNDLVNTVPNKLANGCTITMSFKTPLLADVKPFSKFIKCRLINGFTKETEQWEIVQLYPCDLYFFITRRLK